jgi:hypothetical protein
MSNKEEALNNQVNTDHEGPDLSEALQAFGLGDTEDITDKEAHLDGSDGDLPTVSEVEQKVVENFEQPDVETLEMPDEDDIEVSFNEDGEVVVEKKAEKESDTQNETTKEEDKATTEVSDFKSYVSNLDDELVVKHTIDGEEVEINLKEALSSTLNNHVAKATIDKRFSELDKQKKSLYTEKQSLIKDIEEIGKQASVDNWEGAFEALGKLSGNTPGYLIKEKMISALLPEIKKRSEMTNEELRSEYLKSQNEHLSKLNESEAQKRIAKANQEKLERTVESIRETHKISTQEWNDTFAKLDQEVPVDQDITLEMVKEKVLQERASNEVSSKVDTLLKDVEGVTEEAQKYMADIIAKHPEFTDEQLNEIVKLATTPDPEPVTDNKKEIEDDLRQKMGKTKLSGERADQNQIDQDRIMAILEGDD